MERILQNCTIFLNKYFDFGANGEKPLTKKGALALLLPTVIALVLLVIYFATSGPEHLPRTWEQQKSPTAIGLN